MATVTFLLEGGGPTSDIYIGLSEGGGPTSDIYIGLSEGGGPTSDIYIGLSEGDESDIMVVCVAHYCHVGVRITHSQPPLLPYVS